jgi:hypothetical protein
LFKDVCYVGCPDGYEPDRKNKIECVKIQFGKVYDDSLLMSSIDANKAPVDVMPTCEDYFN